MFIKTDVIGEYANLLLGHRIKEQVKQMTTLAKLQNSRGAQQMHGNNHQQVFYKISVAFLVSLSALVCFSKILPNLNKAS